MKAKLYNLYAAVILFTRIPLWKWINVPSSYFKKVVPYWSLIGWLTGGVFAIVLACCIRLFEYPIAVMLAIGARLLFTGCLHEDGLADFADGFGGGTTKERILAIMKDSHIGTYGVIALIVYFLLFFQLLTSIPEYKLPLWFLVGDCWSKFAASFTINLLPYLRSESEAKIKQVYDRMTVKEFVISGFFGILPALLFLDFQYWGALLCPLLAVFTVLHYLKHKIDGYTGDCCGAVFLIAEVAFWIGMALMCN